MTNSKKYQLSILKHIANNKNPYDIGAKYEQSIKRAIDELENASIVKRIKRGKCVIKDKLFKEYLIKKSE